MLVLKEEVAASRRSKETVKPMPIDDIPPMKTSDPRRPDLAEHFMECGKLGRYLTAMDESRFVVTDDFRTLHSVPTDASAMASVCSKDSLVAQAALLPLGLKASRGNAMIKDIYGDLFELIERETLNPEVQVSAKAIMEAGFTEARIRDIAGALSEKLTPARTRYRDFLSTVKQLSQKQISAGDFRDEFMAFTYDVAGKLDFGIYSFCIDRIFKHEHVPAEAKALLTVEILKFPPLIRRELVSNILAHADPNPSLIRFIQKEMEQRLAPEAAMEITLLVTMKSDNISLYDLEAMAGQARVVA